MECIGKVILVLAILPSYALAQWSVGSRAVQHFNTVTTVMTVVLSSNSNSTGISVTPARKQLGNCANGCTATVLQPAGQPVGQLYCTTTAQSAGVTNGCVSQSVVSVTSSGTGIAAMDNGNGAGGTDSPVTVTDTYGTTGSDSVCTGDASQSLATIFTGLSVAPCVTNGTATFATSTAASFGNSDVLWPTLWASNSTTLDAVNYYYRDIYWCVDNLPTLHDWEMDVNLNSSSVAYGGGTGAYFGWGFDWGGTSQMFRYCPQNCSAWSVLKGTDVSSGATLTSYPLTNGHCYRTRNYGHRLPGCTYTSGSNCFFYDYLTVYDVTAAATPHTYSLVDAGTGLPAGGIPVNHSTWDNGPDTQVQIDMTTASASTQVRVISDTTVYFQLH